MSHTLRSEVFFQVTNNSANLSDNLSPAASTRWLYFGEAGLCDKSFQQHTCDCRLPMIYREKYEPRQWIRVQSSIWVHVPQQFFMGVGCTCLCVYVTVYPLIHLYIYPSTHLPIYLSIDLAIYLSIYLSNLLAYLYVDLSNDTVSVYGSIGLLIYVVLWLSRSLLAL